MATIRKYRWATVSEKRAAKLEGREPVKSREAWQADFVDQLGKRRHKQFKRKKDADAYLIKAGGQVADGTYTAESTSPTIREAADAWIEHAKAEGLERSTIEAYERERDHVLPLIDPDTKLAKLTQARCERLRDELLKAHSRAMARRVLQTFKSIIKDAKRRGMAAQNVAADTTIGTAKRHRKRLEVGVDIPTPDEIKALLDTTTGKARAMICLAAYAGLRASELRGLRWADLDLSSNSNPTVTISQRADRWAEIGSPKSGAARRTIPLGEASVQALRAWKLAQPPVVYREDGEKQQRPATLVFGTGAGKPDMLTNLRKRLIGPAMLAAGVAVPALDEAGKPVRDKKGKPVMHPKYVGLQALRHYAISSWLAAGLDLKLCQRWAGHATLALTLDRYGHFLPRRDEHEMMAAVERGMLGSTAPRSP